MNKLYNDFNIKYHNYVYNKENLEEFSIFLSKNKWKQRMFNFIIFFLPIILCTISSFTFLALSSPNDYFIKTIIGGILIILSFTIPFYI